jgi:DNA-binding transcriptional MocR family regulator
MPAPRKITDQQRQRLLGVIQLRQRIPSDQQLADECGVSKSAIRQMMTLLLNNQAKLHDSAVTAPQMPVTVGSHDRPESSTEGP